MGCCHRGNNSVEERNGEAQMDAGYQKFVDMAAEVAASGRWNAINQRIEELAANPGRRDAWHVQVLASLVLETFGGYLKLKHAFDDSRYDDSVLA
jgi:hypothetical protein